MSGWKSYKLSEFIDINPKMLLKTGDTYSFVEMKDLDEKSKFAKPSQKRELKGGTRFQEFDTLFARITPCLENGKICQVKGLEGHVGFGSTEFLVFRGVNGVSDTNFVFYLSRHPIVRKFAEQNLVGTSGRQRVSKEAFEKIELFLPPLDAQKAIAEILSSLDDKIELNNQINANLEALAQAIFKQWFIDFEFPDENGNPYKSSGGKMAESELGEIPSGWHIGELQDILNVKGGGTPSTKDSSYWDGDIHWTSPKDLSKIRFPVLLDTEKKITTKGLNKISSGLLPKGTLLMSSRAPIGYLAITEIETAINQGYIAINCCHGYSNLFMLYWLSQNMDKVNAAANGSTFLEVNKANFKKIKLVVPDITTHNLFISLIESSFEMLLNNEIETLRLKQLRDQLLPQLISGQIGIE